VQPPRIRSGKKKILIIPNEPSRLRSPISY
jgi:hypothetical protein